MRFPSFLFWQYAFAVSRCEWQRTEVIDAWAEEIATRTLKGKRPLS